MAGCGGFQPVEPLITARPRFQDSNRRAIAKAVLYIDQAQVSCGPCHKTKPPSSPLLRMIVPSPEAATSATAATFPLSHVATVAGVAAFFRSRGKAEFPSPFACLSNIVRRHTTRVRVRVERGGSSNFTDLFQPVGSTRYASVRSESGRSRQRAGLIP